VKKLFLIPAAVIFTVHAGAQTSTLFEDNYPDKKNSIGLDANYFINSNSVTTEFTNAYLTSKFLDSDIKDGSLKKMKDKNTLGSELNGGIYYRYGSKKSTDSCKVSHFFSLKERTHFTTKFPKDLFELYFYGNGPFAGTTADISNFHYRSVQYQQLQFGIMKELLKNDKIVGYAISISALNGEDFIDIKTTDGSLYTAADAQYVDMNLHLESKQSDSTHKSFGSSNGLGASADFEFHYGIKNKYNIRFRANDIGMIAWNSKSFSFEVDTNYHFEGVVVNNLFDSLFLDLKSEQDFKEGFKENKQSKSITTTLPFRFQLSYEKTITPGKLTATLGVEYVLKSDYIPLIFLSGDYYFSSKTRGGICLQYGGYGNFHGGIHIDKDFGKGFILSAGTAYLDGYIMPSSSAGQGAYAGIKKIF
jgi:uncharacterized protein DUF5723